MGMLVSSSQHLAVKEPVLEQSRQTPNRPNEYLGTGQIRAYQEAAKAAGVSFGEWVRRVLDKAVKRELK